MHGEAPTIRLEPRFQGPSGQGQGGWTAGRFAAHLDWPATFALRAAIPLDVDLSITTTGERSVLTDPRGETIMIAEPFSGVLPTTEPVTIAQARHARTQFRERLTDHPAPDCFSCGEDPSSMGVHAGPLGDGRYATDWTPPAWAAADDGTVDPAALWAAVDCTAAWWCCLFGERRIALTAQLTVEVSEPIRVDRTYAIVGWSGDHHPGWNDRKRHAASAAFDDEGRCVAGSASLWISVA